MSIEVIVTGASGDTQTLQGNEGDVLMELLRDNSDGVEGTCGGCAACGTCHVHVAPEWASQLPAAADDELDLIEALDVCSPQSRLSCQLRLTEAMNGLTLTIVPAEC